MSGLKIPTREEIAAEMRKALPGVPDALVDAAIEYVLEHRRHLLGLYDVQSATGEHLDRLAAIAPMTDADYLRLVDAGLLRADQLPVTVVARLAEEGK